MTSSRCSSNGWAPLPTSRISWTRTRRGWVRSSTASVSSAESATRRAQEEIERSQAEMAAALQEKEAARAELVQDEGGPGDPFASYANGPHNQCYHLSLIA